VIRLGPRNINVTAGAVAAVPLGALGELAKSGCRSALVHEEAQSSAGINPNCRSGRCRSVTRMSGGHRRVDSDE